MKYGLVFFALVALALSQASAAPITSFDIENRSDAVERDVPVTFGAVFKTGDVPSGTTLAAVDSKGNAIPLQVDAKARNKDGSMRHAVLTAVLPRLSSGRQITLGIVKGASAQGAPVSLAALPAGFDATINLTPAEGRLSISLRDLMAHTKPEVWLAGPLVGEWWFAGPFRDASGKADPLLSARIGVRSYGQGRPLRIDVVVENTSTWVPKPRTVQYGVEILVGGKQAFSKEKLVQHSHTRWRQVFWYGPAVDTYVRYDLAYLKATRAIPNYNASTRNTGLDQLYGIYQKHWRGPMGNGIIVTGMPSTGQRPDIGPLPAWTVAYLLTMDPRAAEMTMNAADLAGSFPAHYRNERTGRPSTTEEFPKISTHYNYIGKKPGALPLPDTAGLSKSFTPEPSHEPSLAFVPYILTGEHYYLEELQFWAIWNAWGTAPEYHGLGKGLITWDQIRGQAWTLRTLAQAAYATPDADPLKPVLLRQMKNNAAAYDATFTNNPNASVLHIAMRANDIATAVAPWMDDYLTWAAQYAVELGFDEFKPFARWKALFPVRRMIGPDFCYILATKYYMLVKDASHQFFPSWAVTYNTNLPKEYRENPPECGSEEMANALKLKRAGEMMGDAYSTGGYPAQMQPALAAAVDSGIPGAAEAWTKYRQRPVQPKGGNDAKWDILPWGYER